MVNNTSSSPISTRPTFNECVLSLEVTFHSYDSATAIQTNNQLSKR